VGVNIDAAGHGSAHIFDGGGITDSCGMIVDQVLLELANLIVVQNDFGEFPDSGVHPVHDFSSLDLLFQKTAAMGDSLESGRVQFHLFAFTGNGHKLLDGEFSTVDFDGHERDSLKHCRG